MSDPYSIWNGMVEAAKRPPLTGREAMAMAPRLTTVPARHTLGPLRIQFAMVLVSAELVKRYESHEVRLMFLAPSRDNPSGPWEQLTMIEAVPHGLPDDALPGFLRHVVRTMVCHEVDEGLTLEDGSRPWDPHAAERVEVTAVDPKTRTVTVRGVR